MEAVREAIVSLCGRTAARPVFRPPLAPGRAATASVCEGHRRRAGPSKAGRLAGSAPTRALDAGRVGRATPPDSLPGGLTMPTAEVEAWEVASAEATDAEGAVDETRRFEVYRAE